MNTRQGKELSISISMPVDAHTGPSSFTATVRRVKSRIFFHVVPQITRDRYGTVNAQDSQGNDFRSGLGSGDKVFTFRSSFFTVGRMCQRREGVWMNGQGISLAHTEGLTSIRTPGDTTKVAVTKPQITHGESSKQGSGWPQNQRHKEGSAAHRYKT